MVILFVLIVLINLQLSTKWRTKKNIPQKYSNLKEDQQTSCNCETKSKKHNFDRFLQYTCFQLSQSSEGKFLQLSH